VKRILSAGILSLGMIVVSSCQRVPAVRAGNDAPQSHLAAKPTVDANRRPEIRGNLVRVDLKQHTLLLRVENGMDQTIVWNDATRLSGITATAGTDTSLIKVLGRAPGSNLAVDATDDNGRKVAVLINVLDLAAEKAPARKQ